MQMKRVLAVASVLAATVLVATSARAGGANDRLDAEFVVEDTECANRGGAGEASFAFFDVEGTRFGLSGYASGTGTDGDYVEIQYEADLPDSGSASDRTARVSQKNYSKLCVLIESADDSRDVGGCDDEDVFPEKCSVSGMMNDSRNSAKIDVKCSDTSLFRSFLTQAQAESLETAFRNNPCGVRTSNASDSGEKASLTISVNGRPDVVE
jgi:hypothetical protein